MFAEWARRPPLQDLVAALFVRFGGRLPDPDGERAAQEAGDFGGDLLSAFGAPAPVPGVSPA